MAGSWHRSPVLSGKWGFETVSKIQSTSRKLCSKRIPPTSFLAGRGHWPQSSDDLDIYWLDNSRDDVRFNFTLPSIWPRYTAWKKMQQNIWWRSMSLNEYVKSPHSFFHCYVVNLSVAMVDCFPFSTTAILVLLTAWMADLFFEDESCLTLSSCI